jgi:hypothetical protein
MMQGLAKMLKLNQLARAFVGVAFVAGVWRFAEPILQSLLVLNMLTFMRCDMTLEQVWLTGSLSCRLRGKETRQQALCCEQNKVRCPVLRDIHIQLMGAYAQTWLEQSTHL